MWPSLRKTMPEPTTVDVPARRTWATAARARSATSTTPVVTASMGRGSICRSMAGRSVVDAHQADGDHHQARGQQAGADRRHRRHQPHRRAGLVGARTAGRATRGHERDAAEGEAGGKPGAHLRRVPPEPVVGREGVPEVAGFVLWLDELHVSKLTGGPSLRGRSRPPPVAWRAWASRLRALVTTGWASPPTPFPSTMP